MDISKLNAHLEGVLQVLNEVNQNPTAVSDTKLNDLVNKLNHGKLQLEELHSSSEIHIGTFDQKQAKQVFKAVSDVLHRQLEAAGLQTSLSAPMLQNALNELKEALNKNLKEQHKRGDKVADVDESGSV